MVVKCSARLRDAAMQNKKILSGQKDPKDNFSFFVTQYLPEPFKAAREKYKEDVASIYKKNEKQLPKYRKTAHVVGTELSVNNEIRPDPIYPPDIHQVVHALRVQQDKLSSFEFQESSPVCVEDSVFRGYGIRVTQLLSVELAYVKARQRVPNADHIMVAYRIPNIEGSCADGEHYGDLQIMKLLKQKSVTDVAVFVARSKGEANLGARRFQAIRDVVEDVLQGMEQNPGDPIDLSWAPPAPSWSDAEEGDELQDTSPMAMDTVAAPPISASHPPPIASETQAVSSNPNVGVESES